jgi:hypothetical protein
MTPKIQKDPNLPTAWSSLQESNGPQETQKRNNSSTGLTKRDTRRLSSSYQSFPALLIKNFMLERCFGTIFVRVYLASCNYILNQLTSPDAENDDDKYPEPRSQNLNSYGRAMVAERRKACPWYFLGLDGYRRKHYPQRWPYVYEDGEEGNDSNGSGIERPFFPQHEAKATTSESNAAASDTTEGNFWGPAAANIQKEIRQNTLEIAKLSSKQDEENAKIESIKAEILELGKALEDRRSRLDLQKTALAAVRAYEIHRDQSGMGQNSDRGRK